MSKTIEIWHREPGKYKIVSPDRDGELHVSGYTLDVGGEALMEDGVQTVDISNDRYFHIERDDNHATITADDEPPEPETVEVWYEAPGNGEPIAVECTRADIGYEYTGVEIDGQKYDLVERNGD